MNTQNVIIRSEIDKYLIKGKNFIEAERIEELFKEAKEKPAAPSEIREILAKAKAIQTLTLEEAAALLFVSKQDLWNEMKETAAAIKRFVYDNRIVTFAPLYLSNICYNNCVYCGLRADNKAIKRRILSQDEVKKEAEVLAGKIGHKRIIAVFGEHPLSSLDYIVDSMRTIYGVKVKTKNGWGSIRRINVNAAPMSVEDLKILKTAGLGTFQVFQETYHPELYNKLHPAGTVKNDYLWRLTCMHRALEAGVDDVGIGALFGLYDWKFEVLGLLSHAIELENSFGIGPHTISFPRLEPAKNTPFVQETRYKVSDEDFEKAIVVLRLAIPYTGMIITAREGAELRRKLIPLGCTQTDASPSIEIGGYSRWNEETQNISAPSQNGFSQQFYLGDTRSLDEMVQEFAKMGYITSFCTAGYRCGRTGDTIMKMLKTGKEGCFCKLNAVITFREWLDDFASKETRAVGEKLIAKEIEEIKIRMPDMFNTFEKFYAKTSAGERDLYF
jgi:2-iminoacetate synthase